MARLLKEEQSLGGVVGRLEREQSFLSRLWKYELIGGGVLAAVGLGVGFLLGNWWTLGAGLFLAFLGFSHSLKRRDNTTDIGRFKGGAEGEARVTEVMKSGLPEAYIILNDVSVRSGVRSAQNDHLVLGPNGVFVIETKAYSGTLTGKATDDYLEQVKEWKGKRIEARIKNPIPQNEYHLRIVGEKMKEGGFATDDLVSVIVFTNKWARLRIEGSEVPVVKPEMLVPTLLNRKARYAYDEEWLMRLARFLAPEIGAGGAAS